MTVRDAQWTEPDPAVLDSLTHLGCFAADNAVIDMAGRGTGAERTEAAVRAALRMLLANGIITAAEQWPDYTMVTAPEQTEGGEHGD